MTEKRNDKPRNNRPGIINFLIFTFLKTIMINVLAWFTLLIWFTGEVFKYGQDRTISHAQEITAFYQQYNLFNVSVIIEKLNYIFSSIAIINSRLFHKVFELLLTVSQIYLLRLYIYLEVLPIMVLLLFVAITDGLVKRDIRKFQGARESTFTFHRVKSLLGLCLFLPMFIYLSLPLAINPYLVLMPQVIGLSVITMLSISYFKKYL